MEGLAPILTLCAFLGATVSGFLGLLGGLERLPDRPAFASAGILASTLGVVVGATGPLVAPFFLRRRFSPQALIGTQAACRTFVHNLKIAAFGAVSFDFGGHAGLILSMAEAAVMGTWLGKWILNRFSRERFPRLHKLVLLLLALRLVPAGV